MIDIPMPDWLKAFFHSFSQVIIIENVLSGILILAGIFVYDINFGILSVIAAIVGNLTAKLIVNDDAAITSGLYGFSPVLIGIAGGLFFTGTASFIVAILGSFFAVPLTVVLNNLLGRFNLGSYTLPFIVTTWFFILISFSSNLLQSSTSAGLAQVSTLANDGLLFPDVLLKGIGEIFLLDSVWSSALILLGFAVDNWKIALEVVGVVLLTIAIGLLFQVDSNVLNMGLLTYNSILVLMGVEVFGLNKTEMGKYGLILLGVLFAVLVDLAVLPVLGVFALPALTFPFVLTTWIILFFEQNLQPKDVL